MIAVDIRLSPLVIIAHLGAYTVLAMLLLSADLSAHVLGPALILLATVSAFEFGRLVTPAPERIRRLILTPDQAVLFPKSKRCSPRVMHPPQVERCGELMLVLRFVERAFGGEEGGGGHGARPEARRATTLRLWPGSLSRGDASRLRLYLLSLGRGDSSVSRASSASSG